MIRTSCMWWFLVFAAGPPCIGQHLQWTQTGWPRLGGGLALVADQDGDGLEDLATSVRVPDNSTSDGRPEIWFLSSRDGSFLPQRMSPGVGDVFNAVTQAGDFNGDGKRDFLLHGAMQGQNGIHAVCGRTLTRLFRLTPLPGVSWGYGVVSDLDLDGDGRSDIALTVPGLTEIHTFDHLGQLRYITRSPTPSIAWGPAINRFADFDGDGCDDLVVGVGEPTTAGGAVVLSGRTGAALVSVVGPTPGDYLGVGVACCGDLDGDGLPDIAAGGGSLGSPGSVQVFSSATGQRLRAWYSGYYGDLFGWNILATVDLDQDGIPDVIASNPGEPVLPSNPNIQSTLSVFSGRDGSTLLRFADPSGPSSNAGFFALCAVPPAAGSVLPRFAVAGWRYGYDPSTVPFHRGRIWMFEAGPAGTSTLAGACKGTLAAAPRIGLRSLSPTTSRVTLSQAPPGMLALLVLGLSPAATPLSLDPFGFRGCLLHPSIDVTGVLPTGTAGLGAGYAYHDFARGTTSASSGLAVYGQWLVLGNDAAWPGGSTAALRWRLQ
jgi:hypothetical protein